MCMYLYVHTYCTGMGEVRVDFKVDGPVGSASPEPVGG